MIGLEGQEYACNAGDPGLTARVGISPGKGNGNLLWYSSQRNSMDRRDWQATVYSAAKCKT